MLEKTRPRARRLLVPREGVREGWQLVDYLGT